MERGLYVTPRGLSTSPIPFRDQTFEVQFDFVSHKLLVQTSEGEQRTISLYPRSVADFYTEYMACLRSLGIEVSINRTPAEFDDNTPFDQDQHHASYDTKYVESFRRILINTDGVFKQFRARFIGKSSPVHFFWGSFDLAVTRFCGRPAALPENADLITREAYSHEVISCGFWPGDRRFKYPAFYSYTIPAPEGLSKEPVHPNSAYWDTQSGEFLLKYDDRAYFTVARPGASRLLPKHLRSRRKAGKLGPRCARTAFKDGETVAASQTRH